MKTITIMWSGNNPTIGYRWQFAATDSWFLKEKIMRPKTSFISLLFLLIGGAGYAAGSIQFATTPAEFSGFKQPTTTQGVAQSPTTIHDQRLQLLFTEGFASSIDLAMEAPDRVTHLAFSCKDVQVIPPEVFKLHNLKVLDIDSTEIQSLPPEIGNLTQLEVIIAGGFHFTQLPKEIGHLKHLKSLSLSGAGLSKLPDEICELTELESLDLNSNNLREFPKDIGKLKKLKEFIIVGNPLKKNEWQRIRKLFPNANLDDAEY